MTGHARPVHWVATHPGTVRSLNEDAAVCRPDLGVFAVADGVGGRGRGEHASAVLVEAIAEIAAPLADEALLQAVRAAIETAHRRLLAEREGAATTVVALLMRAERFACLWAGDSRAYLLRAGALHRLTDDHSVVGEMLRQRTLTEAEAEAHPAANVITRALGVGAGDERLVDKVLGFAEPDDRFLLCSDGLTKTMDEATIARLLAAGDPASILVSEAVARAARDNVTAVVVRP